MLYSVFISIGAFALSSLAAPSKFQISSPKALHSRSGPDTVYSNILTLKRKPSAKGYNARSAAYVFGKSRAAAAIKTSNHTSNLTSLEVGEEFATTIGFGNETFEVIVDTGSSDTWMVESGFSCVNLETGAAENETYCAFGPTYNVTSTFTKISNENFNISYGDGEFLTGIMGYENVTLAGLTARQEVALVNYAAWEGDGATSGLMGLAYPSLTSAYNGTNPADDNTTSGKQIEYSPLFDTLASGNLTSPLFSLAILRDISGPAGYIALGGLPPVTITSNFTSTPIRVTEVDNENIGYAYYTIDVEGITLEGQSLRRSANSYIIDSGTSLAYMPTRIAYEINAAFFPPAYYDEDEGAFVVDCEAIAPKFGVNINGTVFYVNALDMILLAGEEENGSPVCISGVTDGGDNPEEDIYILGDTFQKNVISVFDIGAGEMRFAAREDYASNNTY